MTWCNAGSAFWKTLADLYWVEQIVDSYLIGNTWYVSRKNDEGQDGPIVDTSWMLQKAQKELVNGLANQLLTLVCHCHDAVSIARYISTYKEERVHASKVLQNQLLSNLKETRLSWSKKIRQALYFSNHFIRYKVSHNCV